MGNGLERASKHLQVTCVILLGLGGVGSAWCGYEASLWSSLQAKRYANAAALRVESTRHSTLAGQQRLVDVTTFVAWAQAYASGSDKLRDFFARRLRPELKVAFDEWLASHPESNPDAAPTPFGLKSYRVAEDETAEALAARAEQASQEGSEANALNDRYARNAIIFALGLFFAGVAQVFSRRALQWTVMGLSGATVALAIIMLLTLPKLFLD